jgi:hypothetical protein
VYDNEPGGKAFREELRFEAMVVGPAGKRRVAEFVRDNRAAANTIHPAKRFSAEQTSNVFFGPPKPFSFSAAQGLDMA